MPEPQKVKIGKIEVGNSRPLILIAGPDSLNDKGWALNLAKIIKEIAEKLNVGYIFKASFDKANRLSISSFRGVGLEKGMGILAEIKAKLDLAVTTDIHESWQAKEVGKVVDLIQIPALLSRQTDLILSAAKTGKAVNIKKGQFMAPADMKEAIAKAKSVGNNNILVTERGTFFGYQNLVVDMRSLEIMKKFGCPVIFDITHSVQLPGAGKGQSSGQPEFIFPLAKAAVSVGVAGIFAEIYESPTKCLVDCASSLPVADLTPLLSQLIAIDKIVKGDNGQKAKKT